MIRLIVSDMDGTLLDRDEKLDPAVVRLAQRLREQGIFFTVATGRVECMAEAYVKALGIDIPYIACNGATIMQGERTIVRHPIPAAPLRPMLEKARAMGMSIIYTIHGKEFVFDATPWVKRQREQFDRYHNVHPFSDEEWETVMIEKVTLLDDVRDGRIQEIEELCKPLAGQYFFTRYTDKSIEAVDPDSNKAAGVRKVAELLGVPMEEVMVLGDHQNDIEMLAEAGLGVAVANATERAKAAADYVCKNRCYEGVLEAVERFCFAGQGVEK